MELWQKYRTLMSRCGVSTPLRIAHFMGQIHHESNLKPISENLNYSAQGLANTWPTRYAVNPKSTPKVPNSTANRLARNPQAIANNAYAGRMGNGDESSGDGYRYRGRGFIQITGRDNYARLSADTGIDYLTNPDLLLTEADSMVSALWFWKTNGLNGLADRDDTKGITKRINGGLNGLSDRLSKVRVYKEKLGI